MQTTSGWRSVSRPTERTSERRRCGRLVWMQPGRPQMVFGFTIADGTVARIEFVADPHRELDLTVPDA